MGGPSGPSGGGSNRYEPPKKKNPIVFIWVILCISKIYTKKN